MPLKVPTLDDRSHADLVREGMELIPGLAPRWTNHNASDPGITLLELFAYVTEIFLYRVDRVTDANKAKFVKLLVGRAAAALAGESPDLQLQQAVIQLRRVYRAVSIEDFERLAVEASDSSGGSPVVRAHCIARRNLEAGTLEERQRDRPGHVSIVFVPADPSLAEAQVHAIRKAIQDHLEPRRLLTTRVHVLAPIYVDAGVRIRVAPAGGDAPADLTNRIRADLNAYFSPQRRGGPPRPGPALGRSVYVSDIFRRLGAIAGVSRVLAVEFDVGEPSRLLRSEDGAVVGVQINAGELFRAQVTDVALESPGARVS